MKKEKGKEKEVICKYCDQPILSDRDGGKIQLPMSIHKYMDPDYIYPVTLHNRCLKPAIMRLEGMKSDGLTAALIEQK